MSAKEVIKAKSTGHPGQFEVRNNFNDLIGEWEETYVNFSGYFGKHGPHVFAAALELLEALEDLEALGSLELPHRRDAALLKAKAAINKAKGITQ